MVNAMSFAQAADEFPSDLVRLRQRGQITIPQAVRDNLGVREGDLLTLFQLGDVIVLTP